MQEKHYMNKFVFQELLFRSHQLKWTCKKIAIQPLPFSLKEKLTDLFSPCINSLYLIYYILFIYRLAKAYLKCKADDPTTTKNHCQDSSLPGRKSNLRRGVYPLDGLFLFTF